MVLAKLFSVLDGFNGVLEVIFTLRFYINYPSKMVMATVFSSFQPHQWHRGSDRSKQCVSNTVVLGVIPLVRVLFSMVNREGVHMGMDRVARRGHRGMVEEGEARTGMGMGRGKGMGMGMGMGTVEDKGEDKGALAARNRKVQCSALATTMLTRRWSEAGSSGA